MKSKMVRIGLLLITFLLIFMTFKEPVYALQEDLANGRQLPIPNPNSSVADITDKTNIVGIIVAVVRFLSVVILVGAISEFVITRNWIKGAELTDEEQKKKKRKAKNELVGWTICSIFMAIVSGVLSMMSNFADKPIIYLYPKKKEKVTVKLNREDKLTCTYPKYNEAWEVMAEPNGNLVDLKTGRNLYGLYYEANKMQDSKLAEGFCVKGEETAKFLEEKLEILGLTEREANEFIIYWLPKLEKNKYNLIRFQEIDLINENMPVEIYPKPDTFIRIIMEYKPLREYVEIKEQKLITPKRERICCC